MIFYLYGIVLVIVYVFCPPENSEFQEEKFVMSVDMLDDSFGTSNSNPMSGDNSDRWKYSITPAQE